MLLRTSLLYNSSKSLGHHVNYVLHGKGNKGFRGKPFSQLKFIYKGLSLEASDMTFREVDLDELLADYQIVSEYWDTYLRRSYSIDLHHLDERRDAKKKAVIFALMDYSYAYEEETKQKLFDILNKKKISYISKDLDRNLGATTNFAIPMMLLLMTRLLPAYSSKQQDVADIYGDFNLLCTFLREYAQQSVACNYFGDTPFLTRYANEMNKARQEAEIRRRNAQDPSELDDEGEVMNRLRLIYMTREFFNTLNTCSNHQNAGLGYRLIDMFYPAIDGIWTETKEDSTTFWKLEQLSNGYFLTQYKKSADSSQRPVLEYTRYECMLYHEHGYVVAYVTHPNVMYALLKYNDISNGNRAWFYAELHEADSRDGNTVIDGIELEAFVNPDGWFAPRAFHRVQNESYYRELIKKSTLVNLFPEQEYTFNLCLAAITSAYLYLELEETDIAKLHVSEDESHYALLKVPKSLDASFDDIDFRTSIGLAALPDGSVYLGSSDHLLYYEITTPEQRERLHVELVKGVDE